MDELTPLQQFMMNGTEEWNDKKGVITIECSISENKISEFYSFAKTLTPLFGGKWVACYCNTCKEYCNETPIHCTLISDKCGELSEMIQSSNFIKP